MQARIAVTAVRENGGYHHTALTDGDLGVILVALRNHRTTIHDFHAEMCGDAAKLPTICALVADHLRIVDALETKLHTLL